MFVSDDALKLEIINVCLSLYRTEQQFGNFQHHEEMQDNKVCTEHESSLLLTVTSNSIPFVQRHKESTSVDSSIVFPLEEKVVLTSTTEFLAS